MNNFLLVLLISVALVALCFVAIGVQVFFGKKKKFPETEIGSNKEMKKRNIKCSRCEELERCALREASSCGACGNSSHNC